MSKFKKRVLQPSGDGAFDLLARCWLLAFVNASRGDSQARQEIVDFFGVGHVARLYRQQLISWHPSEIGG